MLKSVLQHLRDDSTSNGARFEDFVIAGARFLLAVGSLSAIASEIPRPPHGPPLLFYGLLGTYSIYSLAVLALLLLQPRIVQRLSPALVVIDIAWVTSINLVVGDPANPCFLLFVILILDAAYRWGFRRCVTMAVLSAAILVVARVVGGMPMDYPDIVRLFVRCLWLLAAGVLIGYLAEYGKRLRWEQSETARILAAVRASAAFHETLDGTLRAIARAFFADEVLVIFRDKNMDRVFAVSVSPLQEPGVESSLRELNAGYAETYFFPVPADTVHFSRNIGDAGEFTLTANGDASAARLPSAFCAMHAFRSCLIGCFEVEEKWSGRIFLFAGQRSEFPVARTLEFLQHLLSQLVPVLYSVYLQDRERRHDRDADRARVARELHDGAIQSFLGIRWQLDALRARCKLPAQAVQELERVELLLSREVGALRSLLHQMQDPAGIHPDKLVELMTKIVATFREDTGINTQFLPAVHQVNLSPLASYDLVRILQESLMNVHRHSGATSVMVRFTAEGKDCALFVEDNGGGFDFQGRKSLAELDSAEMGPETIKERVRALGGDLIIESIRGRGSKLEVRVGRKAVSASA